MFKPNVSVNVHGVHRPRIDSMRILGDNAVVQVHLVAVGRAHDNHMKRAAGHEIRVNFAALLAVPVPVEPRIFDDHMLAADRIEARIQVKCNRRVRPNALALLQIQVERVRQHFDASDNVQPGAGHEMRAELSVERHFLRKGGGRAEIAIVIVHIYIRKWKAFGWKAAATNSAAVFDWRTMNYARGTYKFRFIFEDVRIEGLDSIDIMY